MEINDDLREMLKELGQAINESISGSGRVHDSIQRIRDEGYNLYMVLDAKVGVNRRSPRAGVRRRSASEAGKAVATSGEDARIAIWGPGEQAPLSVLQGHAAPVVALAVSRDGSKLASASWDHAARLWPLAGGAPRDGLHRRQGE